METEHININQFIDKNDVFPSSITVDWGEIQDEPQSPIPIYFEILRVENSSTPDGIGPRYYVSSNGNLTLDREQVYVGDPLISGNEAKELSTAVFKANNKHIWKYFWSLEYDGPYFSKIWNKIAPDDGILQTNINNLDSFLKEKQIEDFYDMVFEYYRIGNLPRIVTHNFLDWYVLYSQNYEISTQSFSLSPCLLPCKIPDAAVPKLTFNYEG